MSGNDYLNKLLGEARQEPPVISIVEVHSLINEGASAKAPSKPIFSRTLKLIMMSSLSTALVLLLFIWSQNPVAVQNESNQTLKPESGQIIPSKKIEQQPHFQATTISTEPLKEPIEHVNPTTNPPAIIENSNKFMVLSTDELQALHFKVRDGILAFKHELEPEANFHLQMTNKPWFTYTCGSGFEQGALTAMTDIFPIMVSDLQGTNAIWFNYNHKEFERTWLTENLNDFVPIKIILDEKEKAEYPNVMVFWFLRNEKFVAALPKREQDILRKEREYYAFESSETFGSETKEKAFNNTSLSYRQTKNAIISPKVSVEIDEKALKALFFSIADTGIVFQQELADWKYMVFNHTLKNSFEGVGDFDKTLDKPHKYPAFITSDNADELNLSSFLASRITSDKNLLSYFTSQKDQLIPLSYDVRNSNILSTAVKNKWGADKMIFWYYPTDEFLEKLARNNIETQVSNSPNLTLEMNDWAKLHVKMQGDIFEYLYQPKENSFYRARAIMSSHTSMGLRLYNISPLANESKMMVPFGFSKIDGTEFFGISKRARNNSNEALQKGELVAFNSTINPDFIVWYIVDGYLLESLPNLKSQIENRDLSTFPKTFKEYEYKGDQPQADGLNYLAKTAIFATKEQMEALGFSISPSQISLNQKVGKGNIDFYYAKDNNSFSYVSPSIKLFKKPLENVPVFVSENYGEHCLSGFLGFHAELKGQDANKVFRVNRHQYVPVVYNVPFDDSIDFVAWYEPTFEFFASLGVAGTEQNLIRAEIEKHTSSQLVFNTEAAKDPTFEELFIEESSRVGGIRLLELDEPTLMSLNIKVTDKGISHVGGTRIGTTIYNKEGSTNILESLVNGKKQTKIETLPKNNDYVVNYISKNNSSEPHQIPTPKYITDDLAQYWRLATIEAEFDEVSGYKEVKKWMSHNISSSFLIPVLIRTGQDYTSVDKLMGRLRPDLIFWFEPTEEFLSKLPPVVANNIKREMLGIAEKEEIETPFEIDLSNVPDSFKKDTVASCNYFEVCENIKGTISDYSIYPNPARTIVNVQLKSSETCQAMLTVASINGQVFKRERVQLQKNLETTAQIQLDGLSEGMYLVTIETSGGDHFSQRIIKVN